MRIIYDSELRALAVLDRTGTTIKNILDLRTLGAEGVQVFHLFDQGATEGIRVTNHMDFMRSDGYISLESVDLSLKARARA